MKEFWIRAVSLLIAVAALAGYNTVLDVREKDEEIAKLSARLEASGNIEDQEKAEERYKDGTYQASGDAKDQEEAEKRYKDGTYTGEADGFGGKISVEVMIEDGQITEVNILSAENEDKAYLSMAEGVILRILDAQSADVDTVSGATFSSSGIKEAARQALEKAVG